MNALLCGLHHGATVPHDLLAFSLRADAPWYRCIRSRQSQREGGVDGATACARRGSSRHHREASQLRWADNTRPSHSSASDCGFARRVNSGTLFWQVSVAPVLNPIAKMVERHSKKVGVRGVAVQVRARLVGTGGCTRWSRAGQESVHTDAVAEKAPTDVIADSQYRVMPRCCTDRDANAVQRGRYSCRYREGITRAAVTREGVTRTLRGPGRALLVRPLLERPLPGRYAVRRGRYSCGRTVLTRITKTSARGRQRKGFCNVSLMSAYWSAYLRTKLRGQYAAWCRQDSGGVCGLLLLRA